MKYIWIFFFLLVGVTVVYILWDQRGESLQREDNKQMRSVESQISKPAPQQDKIEEDEVNKTVPEVSEANLTLPPPTPQPSLVEQLSLLGANIGDPVFIRIFKYTAELEVWIKVGEQYELLQNYEICRQSGHLGPKLKEGDLVKVKVLEIDRQGRVRLSMKAVDE